MMISKSEFAAGEFDQAHAQLQEFQNNEGSLTEEVMKYFQEYDDDGNQFLDRKELRQFLGNFFTRYHIKVPITDEYVDAVFRSIDKNHDNKIQPDELCDFAKVFIGKLVTVFEEAIARENGEEEKKE